MSADYRLIRSARNGNQEAAEAIVRKYYAEVFDYCKYHSSDIHTAEDLTQEVFLSFFKGLRSYKHCGKLLNYLYTIARNKCIDEKKKLRNTDIPIDWVIDEIPAKTSEVERESERVWVMMAVDRLPHELREVLVMNYFRSLFWMSRQAVWTRWRGSGSET